MRNIIETITLTFVLFLILFGCSSNNSTDPTAPSVPDQFPIVKTFEGPTESKVGQSCTFTATGVDPDGNRVALHLAYWITDKPHTYIELGFTDYVNNDELVSWTIIFDISDHYTLCCYCKDQNGNESSHLQREISVSS